MANEQGVMISAFIVMGVNYENHYEPPYVWPVAVFPDLSAAQSFLLTDGCPAEAYIKEVPFAPAAGAVIRQRVVEVTLDHGKEPEFDRHRLLVKAPSECGVFESAKNRYTPRMGRVFLPADLSDEEIISRAKTLFSKADVICYWRIENYGLGIDDRFDSLDEAIAAQERYTKHMKQFDDGFLFEIESFTQAMKDGLGDWLIRGVVL